MSRGFSSKLDKMIGNKIMIKSKKDLKEPNKLRIFSIKQT